MSNEDIDRLVAHAYANLTFCDEPVGSVAHDRAEAILAGVELLAAEYKLLLDELARTAK